MQQTKSATIAGSMVLEDQLKKVIAKTGPKPYKASDNKMLPRPNHSCFGDFPTTHMPTKMDTTVKANPAALAQMEQSVAAATTAKRKSSPSAPLYLSFELATLALISHHGQLFLGRFAIYRSKSVWPLLIAPLDFVLEAPERVEPRILEESTFENQFFVLLERPNHSSLCVAFV